MLIEIHLCQRRLCKVCQLSLPLLNLCHLPLSACFCKSSQRHILEVTEVCSHRHHLQTVISSVELRVSIKRAKDNGKERRRLWTIQGSNL